MANQITGNVQAVNARLRLRQVHPAQNYGLDTTQRAYSDSNGDYAFTAVAAGTYQIVADLLEATGTYTAASYSFREPVTVTMDAAGDNVANVNLTPIALNAANPVTNSR